MELFVCGFNSFGQLGNLLTSTLSKTELTSIRSFQQIKKAKLIAFARNRAVIIDDNGNITLSGFIDIKPGLVNLENLPFNGEDVIQIGATKRDVLVVTSDGQLWEYKIAPCAWRNLKSLLPISNVEELENKVTKISAGPASVCAVLQDGRAFQLPHHELSASSVVSVCYGYEHGILLTSAGTVMTWGTALRGALGNDSMDVCPEPSEVRALAGIRCVYIAAGAFHSCAVSAEGDLYSWGWNRFGQLGHPTHDEEKENSVSTSYVPMPVDWPVPNPSPVKTVHCGSGHTIVVLENGELWGCGWNKYGQLALEGIEYVSTMTKLPVPPDKKILKVECGYWHTAIFVEDNAV